MAKWWKIALFTNSERGIIKMCVILSKAINDSGVSGLIALDDDIGGVVGAANTPNDLGKQLEGAL